MALLAAAGVRPLADRVLVEPTGGEEMTTSGIVLPDTTKEKPVGSGRLDDTGMLLTTETLITEVPDTSPQMAMPGMGAF